jgi:hypothetical protein
MTPWLRTTLWIVFWATLLVSLVLGAFVAWLLTEVLPPGTVITVDGQHFALPAFSHFGHWFSALLGVLIASLAIVLVVPVVTVLALVVPAALGGLGLALSLLIVALVLSPFAPLGRWLWKSRRKPITISA